MDKAKKKWFLHVRATLLLFELFPFQLQLKHCTYIKVNLGCKCHDINPEHIHLKSVQKFSLSLASLPCIFLCYNIETAFYLIKVHLRKCVIKRPNLEIKEP